MEQTLQNIANNKCKFRSIDEFYDTREVVGRYVIQNQVIGKPSILAQRVEKDILAGREIVDARLEQETLKAIRGFINMVGVTVERFPTEIGIRFGMPQIPAGYIKKGYRNNVEVVNDVIISPTTTFKFKSRFRLYNDESYSIAIITEPFNVSIGVGLGKLGIKGKAEAVIKLIDSTNKLYIDDLSKYMDVSAMIEGSNP